MDADGFEIIGEPNISGDMEKEVLQVDEGDYIKNIMGSFSKKGAI